MGVGGGKGERSRCEGWDKNEKTIMLLISRDGGGWGGGVGGGGGVDSCFCNKDERKVNGGFLINGGFCFV